MKRWLAVIRALFVETIHQRLMFDLVAIFALLCIGSAVVMVLAAYRALRQLFLPVVLALGLGGALPACERAHFVPLEDGGEVAPPDASSWNICPAAWAPSPRIVWCGKRSGVDCYEPEAFLDGDLLPCRYDVPAVVVQSEGEACAACEAFGPREVSP